MKTRLSDVGGLFRFAQVTLLIALIGAGVAAATEGGMYKGYEMPPFDVVDAEGDFELRRYNPHTLAEVTVAGSQTQAVSRGFQVLANYIFGGNGTGEKIAMTVPVAQSSADAATTETPLWTVSFMMPARFSVDDLPAARNEAIRFVTTEPETMLVSKFSGLRTSGKLSKKTAALVAEAEARGLKTDGAPRYFFYDGPMTPPWARRNEVAIRVLPATGS